MIEIKNRSSDFVQGLEKLGFDQDDDCLFFTNTSQNIPVELKFHLEKAKEFKADAIYLRKLLNGIYKPQIYLYDYTENEIRNENLLTEIHKKIWSSGEVPLACIFYDTEIKILNCTTHITDKNTPAYLIENLKITSKANKLYNEFFAAKIKTGIFWEQEELKNQFKFNKSAYDILILNIKKITSNFSKKNPETDTDIINKLIIQCILIKYLEERVDEDGTGLFSNKYFIKYNGAKSFTDVLRQSGDSVNLFEDLNVDFNGNIFSWDKQEKDIIRKLDLNDLAESLEADYNNNQRSFWRYYEFNYVPVELISRLYEEFLGESKESGKGKRKGGLFYTPSHLAKLLIDEAMPLKKFNEVDLDNYKILDPACGSGIFLVLAFKRLVEWWKLQNNFKNTPGKDDLKKLLRECIFGVDEVKQAVRLASFSLCLALCDELKPKEIIDNLRFDDLTELNIIKSDFFYKHNLTENKFNLIIGNPPFVRGGTKKYKDNVWRYDGEEVEIPRKQIALKFFAESLNNLKPNGLQCLIIKSSSLLYNSSSKDFKRLLFSKLNVVQIFDFTALARNKSLWDNGADVDTCAIFIQKQLPLFNTNILHLTFRRTKATKERIFFEIDDYDLHFVNRQTAIESEFIWKNNLLGGGRVKITVDKLLRISTLKDHLVQSKVIYGEGEIGGKSLPNKTFTDNGIELQYINDEYNSSFKKPKNKDVFNSPNLLIKKNIELPFSVNIHKIKFSNEILGIHTDNIENLKRINDYLKLNFRVLKFYIICTSGKMLVYKNTAMKSEDILRIPFLEGFNLKNTLSDIDNNIINDINNFMQLFLRNGENSKAVKPVNKNFEETLKNYGYEFAKILNLVYENHNMKFRLSDVVKLENSFIATIFKYDDNLTGTVFHLDNSKLNLEELSHKELSRHLSVKRNIKLYPQKDTIVFVKPNQYRYWLSLTAYRDADRCFSDLSKLGY